MLINPAGYMQDLKWVQTMSSLMLRTYKMSYQGLLVHCNGLDTWRSDPKISILTRLSEMGQKIDLHTI